MTMKILTFTSSATVQGISYSPDQKAAFNDHELAAELVLEGVAEESPDVTGFTDHDSNAAIIHE